MTVGGVPSRPAGRIGADNVIVGQNMVIAELFGCLGIIINDRWVAADLGLGKNHADMHMRLLSILRFNGDFLSFSLPRLTPCFSSRAYAHFNYIPQISLT